MRDDLPRLHYGDMVRKAFEIRELMRRDDDGAVFIPHELQQFREELLARERVEPAVGSSRISSSHRATARGVSPVSRANRTTARRLARFDGRRSATAGLTAFAFQSG